MKEYISRDYINNVLNKKMRNWFGPEYYACSVIKDEINNAPSTEIVHIGVDLTEQGEDT